MCFRYKPWYLEECSSTLATTYSSGTPGHDKSVATVDMDAKLRPDHICTVEHTGNFDFNKCNEIGGSPLNITQFIRFISYAHCVVYNIAILLLIF